MKARGEKRYPLVDAVLEEWKQALCPIVSKWGKRGHKRVKML